MNKKFTKYILTAASAIILGACLAGCGGEKSSESTAGADNGLGGYPDHNINVIVQYSAGGGTDLSVRGVLDGVKDFPVNFSVSNVTGNAGLIGLCAEKGNDYLCGEGGCNLSGGERQRISIARAFLKDAPIILLDEATASLDVENETLIQESLSKLIQNKTVMIIAHRMRTVTGADKIVVLADGVAAGQGAPDELYKQNDIYKHMVELQTSSQNWIFK